MTVVHIPAGYLADRIGRRKIMWAAWVIGIIATGIMATARSLIPFVIGMILYSAILFVIAPLNSYATSARGKLSIEQAMTSTTAAFYFGGILGPFLGGLIAERVGLRMIYYVAFGIFVLSTLIILFVRHQPPEKKPEKPIRELLHNRRFMLFLPLVFIVFFSLYFPQPLAPNFLRNQREITFQTIGILGSITSLGNVLISLFFGFLPPLIGLLLGHGMVGAFAILVWQTTQTPLLIFAYFLLGGFRATRSLLISQTARLVNQANLGLAYGITETVAGFSVAAAPPLAGLLYSKDPTYIFSITILFIIPSVIYILARRKNQWTI